MRRSASAPAHGSRAFTLIELLVVISIISLLAAVLGVSAWNLRNTAKIKATEGMIGRIEVALGQYRAEYLAYPPAENASGGIDNTGDDAGRFSLTKYLTAGNKFGGVNIGPTPPSTDPPADDRRLRKMDAIRAGQANFKKIDPLLEYKRYELKEIGAGVAVIDPFETPLRYFNPGRNHASLGAGDHRASYDVESAGLNKVFNTNDAGAFQSGGGVTQAEKIDDITNWNMRK